VLVLPRGDTGPGMIPRPRTDATVDFHCHWSSSVEPGPSDARERGAAPTPGSNSSSFTGGQNLAARPEVGIGMVLCCLRRRCSLATPLTQTRPATVNDKEHFGREFHPAANRRQ